MTTDFWSRVRQEHSRENVQLSNIATEFLWLLNQNVALPSREHYWALFEKFHYESDELDILTKQDIEYIRNTFSQSNDLLCGELGLDRKWFPVVRAGDEGRGENQPRHTLTEKDYSRIFEFLFLEYSQLKEEAGFKHKENLERVASLVVMSERQQLEIERLGESHSQALKEVAASQQELNRQKARVNDLLKEMDAQRTWALVDARAFAEASLLSKKLKEELARVEERFADRLASQADALEGPILAALEIEKQRAAASEEMLKSLRNEVQMSLEIQARVLTERDLSAAELAQARKRVDELVEEVASLQRDAVMQSTDFARLSAERDVLRQELQIAHRRSMEVDQKADEMRSQMEGEADRATQLLAEYEHIKSSLREQSEMSANLMLERDKLRQDLAASAEQVIALLERERTLISEKELQANENGRLGAQCGELVQKVGEGEVKAGKLAEDVDLLRQRALQDANLYGALTIEQDRLRYRMSQLQIDFLEVTDRRKPQRPAAWFQTARYVHELIGFADRARDRGDWKLARELYRRYLNLRPIDGAIWTQYGNVSKENGDLGDAIDAYSASIRLMPHVADTYLQLGRALRLSGQVESARAAFGHASDLGGSRDDVAREIAQLPPERT